MERWEYLKVKRGFIDAKELDELGMKGWELITINNIVVEFILIFKRKLNI